MPPPCAVAAPRRAPAARGACRLPRRPSITHSPPPPPVFKRTAPQIAIEQAKYFDRCKALPGSERTACQIDKALVNLGALFLEKVEGRVSTEVDPRVANDTGGWVGGWVLARMGGQGG